MIVKTRKYYIIKLIYNLVLSLLCAGLNPLFLCLGIAAINIPCITTAIITGCAAILCYILCYWAVMFDKDTEDKRSCFDKMILDTYHQCSKKSYTMRCVKASRVLH